MADVKVIVVQAGEEFLAALTKLLGSEAAQAVQGAVKEAVDATQPIEEEIEVEETFDFGQVVSDGLEDDGDSYSKTYKVLDASDLSVVVTDRGVEVEGLDVEGDEFEDIIAPNGAFDEVTAYFDQDEETLHVTLFKVDEGGKVVEIEGF